MAPAGSVCCCACSPTHTGMQPKEIIFHLQKSKLIKRACLGKEQQEQHRRPSHQ